MPNRFVQRRRRQKETRSTAFDRDMRSGVKDFRPVWVKEEVI